MPRHAATVCFDASLGRIEIEAADDAVTRVRLDGHRRPREVGDGPALDVARQARREIEAYLGGRSTTFTVPIAVTGTPFQLAVWQELRAIPFGETRSYGEIGATLGMQRGGRAVGAACRANKVPIFVPCHRVVGSNGSLGGFSGGVSIKARLLALERGAPLDRPGAAEVAAST